MLATLCIEHFISCMCVYGITFDGAVVMHIFTYKGKSAGRILRSCERAS